MISISAVVNCLLTLQHVREERSEEKSDRQLTLLAARRNEVDLSL